MNSCTILYILTIILQNFDLSNLQKSAFLENDLICYNEVKKYKNTTTDDRIFSNYLSKLGKPRKCEKACYNYSRLKNQIQNYIIGGETSSTKTENPYIVALGYSNKKFKKYQFSCGGSLISPSFVLTAAHCIINPEKTKLKFIRIGSIFVPEFIEKLDPLHDILVKNYITHPDFQTVSKLNDIAVIELEKSLNLEYSIQPICLYTTHDEPQEMEIAGWGSTENKTNSVILQIAYVNPIPQEQCRNVYYKKYFLKIKPTHVCAGNDTRNTCKGDSGGPLRIEKNGISYLVGVTAGGAKCGSKTPGIYTRVSSYLDWIEKIVWP